jgi:hypothetical protein
MPEQKSNEISRDRLAELLNEDLRISSHHCLRRLFAGAQGR